MIKQSKKVDQTGCAVDGHTRVENFMQKPWLHTRDIIIGGKSKAMNEYYHTHPHHILGNLEIVPMYDRTGLTCKRRGNPFHLLRHILGMLKQERLAKLFQEISEMGQKEKELQAYRLDLIQRICEFSSLC